MDIINFISENWIAITAAFSAFSLLLTQVAALTPWNLDDKAAGIVTKIVKYLTGNYGNQTTTKF